MIALPGTTAGRAKIQAVGMLLGVPVMRRHGSLEVPPNTPELETRAQDVLRRAQVLGLSPLLWIVGGPLQLFAVGQHGSADVLAEMPPGPKIERLSKGDL